MSTLKNKVQLIGNLGADPEIFESEKGKKVARLSLAVNDSYKDAEGNKKEQTDWFPLVAFGKTADLIEKILSKGDHLAIEGTLRNHSWEDKEGNKRRSTEVVLSEFIKLNAKSPEA